MAAGTIVKDLRGVSGRTDVGALVGDGEAAQRYFAAGDIVGFRMEDLPSLGRNRGGVRVTFTADGDGRATDVHLA